MVILKRISSVGTNEFVRLIPKFMQEPIKPELIEQRIDEIKQQKGGIVAVSAHPAEATKYRSIVA